MNNKMSIILNSIGKHYRSEMTIHDFAEREYDPYHTDHLYLTDVQRALDNLVQLNFVKMIRIPILNERFYKINKESLKKSSNESELQYYPPDALQFQQILVRQTNNGPYYEILYYNKVLGEVHIGYASYNIDTISEYLREYFFNY